MSTETCPLSSMNRVNKSVLMKMYVAAVSNRLRQLNAPSVPDRMRWCWELIQNARDSIIGDATRQYVDVVINVDENLVKFSHNGTPFHGKNLLGLLYKYSEGKRGTESTGQFGTGFMTTHALGKVVKIETDVFEDEGEQEDNTIVGFSAVMHRNGETSEQLEEGFKNTWKSMTKLDHTFGWTILSYQLHTDLNREARDLGVKSLKKLLQPTFVTCKELRKVTLDDFGTEIVVERGALEEHGNVTIQHITKRTGDEEVESVFAVFAVDEDGEKITKADGYKRRLKVTIAVQLVDDKLISQKGQTCLFCTFPFVGSEKYQLPFICNSPVFEPETERQGLQLSTEEYRDGKITESGINFIIMEKVVGLYQQMIDYLIAEDVKDLQYLANGLDSLPDLDDGTRELYMEKVTRKMRDILLNSEVVTRQNGERMKLKDAVFLKFGNTEEAKMKQLYELFSYVEPNAVAYQEAINWQDWIWEDIKIIDIEEITQRFKETDYEGNWEMVNSMIDYLDKETSLLSKIPIVPNMLMQKVKLTSEFCESKTVNEDMLMCMDLLNIPWKKYHMHNKITSVVLHEDTMNDAVERVKREVKANQKQLAPLLVTVVPVGNEYRTTMHNFASQVLPDIDQINNVSEAVDPANTLWEECDAYIIKELISTMEQWKPSQVQTELALIDQFIQFLNQHNLFRTEYSIVPNAVCEMRKLGNLKRDEGMIPDRFKEMAQTYFGINISQEELHKEITALNDKELFKLPVSRVDDYIDGLTTWNTDKKAVSRVIISYVPVDDGELKDKQLEMNMICRRMIDSTIPCEELKVNNPRLWQMANDYMRTEVRDHIAHFGCLSTMSEQMQITETEAVDLINIICKTDADVLIPNYKGTFRKQSALQNSHNVPTDLLDLLELIDKTDTTRENLTHPDIKSSNINDFNAIEFYKKVTTMANNILKNKSEEKPPLYHKVADKVKAMSIFSTLGSEKEMEAKHKILVKMCVSNIKNRLRMLKSNPSKSDEVRWAWELIQNAKDTIVGQANRKVSITIELVKSSTGPDMVRFIHNGSEFTVDTLFALLYKYSECKEYNGSTGQFGTGFLTTHLLSTHPTLKSDFIDEHGNVHGFSVTIYRDGTEKTTLTESVQKMDESRQMNLEPFGRTVFEYPLEDDNAKRIRDEGLKSIMQHLPATLIFEQSIENISIIRKTDDVVDSEIKFHIEEENEMIKRVIIDTNGEQAVRRYIVKSVEKPNDILSARYKRPRNLTVVCAVEVDSENGIVSHSSTETSLFCTFPLVGSEEHILPMIINSPDFEPNTERNALLLYSHPQSETIPAEVQINYEAFKYSLDAFREIIDYCSRHNFTKLYHLIDGLKQTPNVSSQTFSKVWWEKSFLPEIRKTVLEYAVFITPTGVHNLQSVLVPRFKHSSRDAEQSLYELLTMKYDRNKIVVYEEATEWNSRMWKDFEKTVQITDLYTDMENAGSVSTLVLNSGDKWDYINKLLLFTDKWEQDELRKCKLVPNWKEQFCVADGAFAKSIGVDGDMVKLLEKVEVKWSETHSHDRVTVLPELKHKITEHTISDAETMVMRKVERHPDRAFSLMSYLCADDPKRDGMYRFSRWLFSMKVSSVTVQLQANKRMWVRADKLVMEELLKKIEGTAGLSLTTVNDFIQFADQYWTSFDLPGSIRDRKIFPDVNCALHTLHDLYVDGIRHDDLKRIVRLYWNGNLDSEILHPSITAIRPAYMIAISSYTNRIGTWWNNKTTQTRQEEYRDYRGNWRWRDVTERYIPTSGDTITAGTVLLKYVPGSEGILTLYNLTFGTDHQHIRVEGFDDTTKRVMQAVMLNYIARQVANEFSLTRVASHFRLDEGSTLEHLDRLTSLVMSHYHQQPFYNHEWPAFVPNMMGNLCQIETLKTSTTSVPIDLIQIQGLLDPSNDLRKRIKHPALTESDITPLEKSTVYSAINEYIRDLELYGVSNDKRRALWDLYKFLQAHGAMSQLPDFNTRWPEIFTKVIVGDRVNVIGRICVEKTSSELAALVDK